MKQIFLKLKNKTFTYANIYITLSVLAMVALFISVLLSHGEVLSKFFFYDEIDTGMDFFHSIEYVKGRSPYVVFNTLYPPLANLLFYGLFRCIPVHVSECWSMDFYDSLNMRQSEFDLRTYQAPMILFLGMIIFSIIIIVFLAQRLLLQRYNIKYTNAIVFCMIFSYGMMWAIERGNIIMLIFPLTLFFLFYYKSERRWVRELACICLAVAAGIKVYPALMGILLLKDKKWKMAIRTIIYGVLSLFLPFLFFKGGLLNIKIWMQQMMQFGTGSNQPWIGNSLKSIFYRFQNYASYYLKIEISDKYFGIIVYMILLLLFICVLNMKKRWQAILIVTTIMCLYSEQGNYIYLFYCIPLLSFLLEETEITLENLIPYIGMILMILPLPLFSVVNQSYPRTALVHCVDLVLIVWSVYELIKNRKADSKLLKKELNEDRNG